MGYHKKLHQFTLDSSSSYGFPIEEHMDYWIKKYEKYLDNIYQNVYNDEASSCGSEGECNESSVSEGLRNKEIH